MTRSGNEGGFTKCFETVAEGAAASVLGKTGQVIRMAIRTAPEVNGQERSKATNSNNAFRYRLNAGCFDIQRPAFLDGYACPRSLPMEEPCFY